MGRSPHAYFPVIVTGHGRESPSLAPLDCDNRGREQLRMNLTPFSFQLSSLRPAGEWSMRSIGVALSILFLTMSASYGQPAWCEKNCVSRCNDVYGASNSGPCIAEYQCSQFAGRPCASDAVVYSMRFWCENNCVALCNKVYGASNSGPCIAHYQCSRFAGNQCASDAVVNIDAMTHCSHFNDCVAGRAIWGSGSIR
jgi:hypothetical protein